MTMITANVLLTMAWVLQEMHTMEWSGKWIRGGWATPHCPWMKTGFGIEKEVRSATLHVTALGVCEAWINGQRVGDTHLVPGWTDYRKRVYYHSFEVGELLCSGENRLGAVLGQGWYAGFFGPFQHKGYYGNDSWFSCVLEINFKDGSSQTVCSDKTWTWQIGPLQEADLLMGETYDARQEIDGWCDPECTDGDAHPVYVVNGETQLPERIEAYPGVPVRTITQLPAQSVAEPKPGVYVFDLAQNMVGVAQLKVAVPAGTEIVLKHGEMLNDDGTVYTENLRYAKATDRYALPFTASAMLKSTDCPPGADALLVFNQKSARSEAQLISRREIATKERFIINHQLPFPARSGCRMSRRRLHLNAPTLR